MDNPSKQNAGVLITSICRAIPHGKEFERTPITLYTQMIQPIWEMSVRQPARIGITHTPTKKVLAAVVFLFAPGKVVLIGCAFALPFVLKARRALLKADTPSEPPAPNLD